MLVPAMTLDKEFERWIRENVKPSYNAVRALNALLSAGIGSLDELRTKSRNDLLKVKHLGAITVTQLVNASRVDPWMEDAMRHCRNEQFYRGIICQIGEMFGVEAKTSDDGSIQQDVLALKVPELVARLKADLESAKAEA